MRDRTVGATTGASLMLALGAASLSISACGSVEPDLGSDSLAGDSLQVPPIRAIVSDPVLAQGASSEAPARSAPAAVSELEVVYVSLAPGSTDATELAISNEATNFSAMVSIVEGGFDPVVVPASVGNTLGFGLFFSGIRIGTWSTRVEAFRRPIVVRTNPSRGQRDIPVASSVAVVFSEPMDPATVTPSTVRLLRDGVPVGGTVTLAPDGLSALFIPESPLAAGATHVLSVDAAVRDLDGDSLGVAELVEFTTTVPIWPPASLAPWSGSAQFAAPGEILPTPLVVRVVDVRGNAVPGVAVTFAVTLGGGHIAGGPSVTDDLGIASSGTWTLGLEPGWQEVRAQAGSAQTGFSAWAGPTFRGLVVQDDFPNPLAIYRINENGEPALAFLAAGDLPAWSPDGRRIAFKRQVVPCRVDVFVMDPDGSNVVRLTHVGGEGPYPSGSNCSGFGWPTWSPDGERLAVATGGIYVGDIFVVSATDDQQMPIHIASMAGQPAWSPDGTKIAFVRLSGDDGYHALHVMNADGSDVRQVVPSDGSGIGGPTWSPDGQRIAFSRGIGAWDLYSVSLDGSALTKLTDGLATSDPAWSPDGAWIAFTLAASWPERADSIGVVPALTGGRPFVVAAGRQPDWQR